MVISCLVKIVQGGGGEVLPRFGMLENSPKTVKCVITFEPDCRRRGRVVRALGSIPESPEFESHSQQFEIQGHDL